MDLIHGDAHNFTVADKRNTLLATFDGKSGSKKNWIPVLHAEAFGELLVSKWPVAFAYAFSVAVGKGMERGASLGADPAPLPLPLPLPFVP